MKLDTAQCIQIADAIGALKQSQAFDEPSLQSRHEQIQAKLSAMESFFRKLAQMVEANENQLCSTRQIAVADQAGGYAAGQIQGLNGSLLAGRVASASGTMGIAVGAASYAWSSDYANAQVKVSALEGSVSGKAYLQLLKGKQLDPSLRLEAAGNAHLAAAEVNAGVDLDNAAASIRAAGEVGAVYGSAQAVLSKDEQTLSAQVGAAALRGECTMAFELANIRVSVGVSGSVGSMEAGFEYSNKPGTWQVGVNGALFAGGGLRLQVEY